MVMEKAVEVIARYADGKLLAGRVGQVAVVMFNQPERRNAISLEMWDGICSALDMFAAENDVRVLVYAGAGGKAFSSGNDISEFATRRGTPEAQAEFARVTGRGAERLASFPKPSIACIEGYCMGGGFGMALQADLRVAAPSAVFGVPAARLGIAYGMEPMRRLVAQIGPARARLMLYTGRKFTAEQALAMGIVEVLATEDVIRETLDLAQTIAENAPLSIKAFRFTLAQLLRDPEKRDVAGVEEHTRQCMESADYREGRTAFIEKRKPVFVGV